MNSSSRLVVAAHNITHRYGRTVALDNITLEVPAGTAVGLIGPDGVGKSTLMGLIAGARRLQQGSLHVLGGELSLATERNRVGPRIAYMPQGLGKNLYADLSIFENLDFFGKLFGQAAAERKTRIKRLTEATGLHPFLSRPARKLSGGMKQKLGLCCALIHDPDLLILDEPTTGVDPLSRRQFWELITKIRAERPAMSVLVSTAYMDEAADFDWLIAMNEGRVIGTGKPDELMARTGTEDLEAAYVALLPGGHSERVTVRALPPRPMQSGQPAIAVSGLTRRFGGFTAVSNVDLTIERGEIFGFLGSNGCGKTTTMKMLTGLLPPSEGRAYLFGSEVDAGSNAMRRRVGYMSQSFSLYGELTVRQNLELHARLFQLDNETAAARIHDLAHRFDLALHMDDASDSLPLGLRQRLSLAVAILHEPEMLILDEPTSGVDPLARDRFWDLLIELSRRDGVTIFISTHFMNEAMRCDRISLMHAGEVLAMGTPAELIEKRGASSLEEAFIACMSDAIGPPACADRAGIAEAPAIPLSKPEENNASGRQITRLSMSRALAYSYRETKELLRDPVRLIFAFIGSTILLFIFSYGITTDVDRLKFAVFDGDRSPMSRAYINEFRGSHYFDDGREVTASQELARLLTTNAVAVAIEIPPAFGRNIARGARPMTSIWIDGANTTRAASMVSYVQGVHERFVRTGAVQVGNTAQIEVPVLLEMRFLYNPAFESIYAIAPGVPAMLLILFPSILMAVSIAREKEIGTITNFYVTPTRRIEFLVGKQLPYIAMAMLNFAIMTLAVIWVIGVPLKGSFVTLMLGALLYGAVTTGIGLVIATFVSNQFAAVFAAAIVTMMPTMQFSGFLQPVSTLEGGARLMGLFWPTTYYMHMSVGVFTKGLGMADLRFDMLALAAFIPLFIAIAVLGLNKQER